MHTSPPWRIWLVTDVYPPGCGGSGWSTHSLARTLVDNGHAVEVISLNSRRSVPVQRTYDGITVSEVGVWSAHKDPRRRLGSYDYTFHTLSNYLGYRLLREPEVDLLHAQHLHSGPPAVLTGRVHGRATVQTLRDYWPVCLHGTSWWDQTVCTGCNVKNLQGCMSEYWGWPRPLARMMVPWARRRLVSRRHGVKAAHRILAVSDSLSRRIKTEFPEFDLSVVPNVVDQAVVEAAAAGAADLTSTLPSRYLLAAGKLLPTKGFDLLLTALHEVNAQLPLVIAGDGPERRTLEEQAASLNLKVHSLGWVEHSALLRLQQRAHAVILPSAWDEPLSRFLLESMALGTPVIAWARGGSTEVIKSSDNGWLVNNPADLGLALAFLESSEQRQQMAAAAQATILKSYSPDVVYTKIAEVYVAAIERARKDKGKYVTD